ncbi:hypothetical protein WISP_106086 [Willisornis vidua]|uniref:Uncharacterized protein n=1 Tax=Willisornis vidua TaxID=1566151 RepID=A0ABQ9D275_9PASS|nr:hypothetical protein WISP_106086 [Willisornis vidua]
MEDHRLPKIVLYGELTIGCRKRGALKKRYKDYLKEYHGLGHIDCHQWSTLASSRDSQRHTIHDAAASFENAHRVSLEEKGNAERTVPNQSCLRRLSTVSFLTRLAYPPSPI